MLPRLPSVMRTSPLKLKTSRTGLTWFTVALCCTAAVILLLITVIASSLGKTRGAGQGMHSGKKPGALAKVFGRSGPGRRPSYKPPPLNHTLDLYCVFDVQAAMNDYIDITDAPLYYCNNLVICCIMDIFYELQWHVWNAVATVRHMSPETTVFVGFKAEGDVHGDWFYSEIKTTNRTGHLVNKIIRTIEGHDVNGGVFIWVPNFDEVPHKHMVAEFLRNSNEGFSAIHKKMIITLPEDVRDLEQYFPVSLVKKPHVYFVLKTHFVPPYNMTDYVVSCTAPWRYPNSTMSIYKALVNVNRWLGSSIDVVSPKLIPSFDVTAYSYRAVRRFPYPLTGRTAVTYREFCMICSTRAVSWNFWKTYRDHYTSCYTAVAEEVVMSAANPEMARSMLIFFRYNLRAFVVYNVHLDDYSGVCGNKFGFVRRLYCYLEKIPSHQCSEIGME